MPAADKPRRLDCRGRLLPLGAGTHVMGILNVTPDSFYDGGRLASPEAAGERAVRMVGEGASALDLGGQSTRPGHQEISAEEEIARVIPALERIVPQVEVPVSIDTYKPAVARAALAAGAHWINDVQGFQGDPAMAEVAAEFGCPAIVMHQDPAFAEQAGDPVAGLLRFFERSLEIAARAGVPAQRIVIDPGMGFFKTADQQLAILRRLGELRVLGCPILLGISRKSLVGRVTGAGPEERLEGSLAAAVLGIERGVDLLRVHDVAAHVRAVRMTEAILNFPAH